MIICGALCWCLSLYWCVLHSIHVSLFHVYVLVFAVCIYVSICFPLYRCECVLQGAFLSICWGKGEFSL